VLGTIGTSNGQFIVLPIGRYAQLVKTPQQAAAVTTTATPSATPAIVYQDAETTVTAMPLSDGTVQIQGLMTAACDSNDAESCNVHQ